MRSSMLEVLNQDYLRTARAKGLREYLVIMRHAFRNALIPTLTIIGVTFGSLLAIPIFLVVPFLSTLGAATVGAECDVAVRPADEDEDADVAPIGCRKSSVTQMMLWLSVVTARAVAGP